jgi:hypothetical protein
MTAHRRRSTHDLYLQISPWGAWIWAQEGRICEREGAGGGGRKEEEGEDVTKLVMRPASGHRCHPSTAKVAVLGG